MTTFGAFLDEAEFLAAYNGDMGPEAEAEADELVDSGEIELVEEPTDTERAEEEWRFDLNRELNRLSDHLERPLTSEEVRYMAEDTKGLRQLPDFIEKFGGLESRTTSTPEERQDFMAEVMDDIDSGQDVVVDADGRPYREEPVEEFEIPAGEEDE